MVNINIKTKNLWKKYSAKNTTVWIKGYLYSHTKDNVVNICKSITKKKISSFIKSIDGHFALIVQRKDIAFITVDKIRSTPLFFVNIKNNFFIDTDPKNLINIKEFNNTINQNAKLELSMSGFTIGNKTIYKNLNSLKAGEIVLFEKNEYKYIQYYKYFGKIIDKNFDNYLKELSEVTLNIFQKMLKQIGNKQIIIPLSAGNDSRLVASILKHLGAKNVKCYSYGTVSNFEAKIAKIVAQKLGYEWKFIPLTHQSERKFYASNDYKQYLKYSETFCSVPYFQSLSTIKYLKNINWIDSDAIFVNGNGGDFISGGHIDLKIQNKVSNANNKLRKENILNQLIERHFSLWGCLKTKNNIVKIKKNLWNEIKLVCSDLTNNNKDHLFYEYSEFIDRQSKYVISGQKIYEYYNHHWRLPLWDDEYLYFWQKVPLEYKLKQKLFTRMLKDNNFGNVWGKDIPVNKKTITPKWIIPLRFICKIPFGFFGKKGKNAWKQFDINFFYYFRDLTHMMDTQNYLKVIRDIFKKPQFHVSWQAEDYLKKIEINKNYK
jgi:asparagine synthase (glutamine-hydrolysing)